jgi:hypothetical protein
MTTITHSINIVALTLVFALGSNISMAEAVNKAGVKQVAKPNDSLTIKAKPAKRPAIALDKKIVVEKLPNNQAGDVFGTDPGRADLIITPFYQGTSLAEGHPGQSYCEATLSGGTAKKIWFYIRNTGDAASAPAQVKIFFNTFVGGGASAIYQQNITALAAGGSQVFQVAMPDGCYPEEFSTSCHFRIVADTTYVVQEHSEGNNHIDSRCVGPAG